MEGFTDLRHSNVVHTDGGLSPSPTSNVLCLEGSLLTLPPLFPNPFAVLLRSKAALEHTTTDLSSYDPRATRSI